MTNKGIAAPLFWEASEKRVFLLHLNTGLPAGLTSYWSERGSAFELESGTSTKNARSNRETHRREMVHYRVTEGNRVPSA